MKPIFTLLKAKILHLLHRPMHYKMKVKSGKYFKK